GGEIGALGEQRAADRIALEPVPEGGGQGRGEAHEWVLPQRRAPAGAGTDEQCEACSQERARSGERGPRGTCRGRCTRAGLKAMVSPSSRPVQHEGPAGALGTEGREPPGAGKAARSPAAECGIRTSRRGVPHPPRACARRRLDEILMLYTV